MKNKTPSGKNKTPSGKNKTTSVKMNNKVLKQQVKDLKLEVQLETQRLQQDLDNALQDRADMQAKLNIVNGEYGLLEEENMRLVQEGLDKDNQITNLQQQNQLLQNQPGGVGNAAQLQQDLVDARAERDQARQDLSDANGRYVLLEEEHNLLEEASKDLIQEGLDKDNQITNLQQQNQQLQQDLVDARAERDQALNAVNGEYDLLEEEYSLLDQAVVAKDDEITHLKQEKQQLQQDLVNAQAERDTLKTERDNLIKAREEEEETQGMQKLFGTHQEVENEQFKLKAENEQFKLKAENEKLKLRAKIKEKADGSRKKKSDAANAAQQAQYTTLQGQHNALQGQHNALQGQHNALQGQHNTLQADMQNLLNDPIARQEQLLATQGNLAYIKLVPIVQVMPLPSIEDRVNLYKDLAQDNKKLINAGVTDIPALLALAKTNMSHIEKMLECYGANAEAQALRGQLAWLIGVLEASQQHKLTPAGEAYIKLCYDTTLPISELAVLSLRAQLVTDLKTHVQTLVVVAPNTIEAEFAKIKEFVEQPVLAKLSLPPAEVSTALSQSEIKGLLYNIIAIKDISLVSTKADLEAHQATLQKFMADHALTDAQSVALIAAMQRLQEAIDYKEVMEHAGNKFDSHKDSYETKLNKRLQESLTKAKKSALTTTIALVSKGETTVLDDMLEYAVKLKKNDYDNLTDISYLLLTSDLIKLNDEQKKLLQNFVIKPETDAVLMVQQMQDVANLADELMETLYKAKLEKVETDGSKQYDVRKKTAAGGALPAFLKGDWDGIPLDLAGPDRTVQYKALYYLEHFTKGLLTAEQQQALADARVHLNNYDIVFNDCGTDDATRAINIALLDPDSEYQAKYYASFAKVNTFVAEALFKAGEQLVDQDVKALLPILPAADPNYGTNVISAQADMMGIQHVIAEANTHKAAATGDFFENLKQQGVVDTITGNRERTDALLNRVRSASDLRLNAQQKQLVNQAMIDFKALWAFEGHFGEFNTLMDQDQKDLFAKYEDKLKASLPKALEVCNTGLSRFNNKDKVRGDVVLKVAKVAGVLLIVGVGIAIVATGGIALATGVPLTVAASQVGAGVLSGASAIGSAAWAFASTALSGDVKGVVVMLAPIIEPLSKVAEMVGMNTGTVYDVAKMLSFFSVVPAAIEGVLRISGMGENLSTGVKNALATVSVAATAVGVSSAILDGSAGFQLAAAAVAVSAPLVHAILAAGSSLHQTAKDHFIL